MWVPVLLALALRIGFVAATPGYMPLQHDDVAYNYVGCRIAEEGYFPPYRDHYKVASSAYRPPVYPYFLGGIYTLTGCDSEQHPTSLSAWPRYIGGVLGAIAVALIAWLGARWWGRRAGLWAGLVAAIFGPAVVVGSELLSEQTFTTLTLAAIVAAVLARDSTGRRRWLWIAAAGVTVGLAALTRANGALLIPVLAAAVVSGRPLWSRRALLPPLVLALAAVLTIAPWTLRNLRDVHQFIPVSDEAGMTLAGTYNDVSRSDTVVPASWHRPDSVPSLRPIFIAARHERVPEPTLQHRLQKAALDYAQAHPGYVGQVAYRNTLRLAGLDGHVDYLAGARSLALPEWSSRVAWSTCTFAVLLALLAVATRAARGAPRFPWVGALLLLLSTVLVNADGLRFMVPFGPFEALLAGAAIAALLERARRRSARRRAVAA